MSVSLSVSLSVCLVVCLSVQLAQLLALHSELCLDQLLFLHHNLYAGEIFENLSGLSLYLCLDISGERINVIARLVVKNSTFGIEQSLSLLFGVLLQLGELAGKSIQLGGNQFTHLRLGLEKCVTRPH